MGCCNGGYHEFNLDWLISELKKAITEWQTVKTEWADMKSYIQNYFKNLDLQDEVNIKIEQMLADGELEDIIERLVLGIKEAWISVKDYGAKGDGVTDDADAIQNCIDQNPGRTIFFPDGVYMVSRSILSYSLPSKHVNFKGTGNSVIRRANNNFYFIMKVDLLWEDNTGNEQTNDNCDLLEIRTLVDGLVFDAQNYGAGLLMFNSICPLITNCRFLNCSEGLRLNNNNSGVFSSEGNIVNCQFWRLPTAIQDTTVAIKVFTPDTVIKNCTVMYYDTACDLYAYSFIDTLHHTGAPHATNKEALSIVLEGCGSMITELYIDTCNCGIYVKEQTYDSPLTVNRLYAYNYREVSNQRIFDFYLFWPIAKLDNIDVEIYTNQFNFIRYNQAIDLDSQYERVGRFEISNYQYTGNFGQVFNNKCDMSRYARGLQTFTAGHDYNEQNYVPIFGLLCHDGYKFQRVFTELYSDSGLIGKMTVDFLFGNHTLDSCKLNEDIVAGYPYSGFYVTKINQWGNNILYVAWIKQNGATGVFGKVDFSMCNEYCIPFIYDHNRGGGGQQSSKPGNIVAQKEYA